MKLTMLAAALAVSATGAAWAAPAVPAAVGGLPPPGLYRIDMDSTMAFAGHPAEVRSITQGANGDTEAQYKAGGKSATRQFKGNAPVTQCIKPYKDVPVPADMMGCTAQSSVKTADGVLHTSSCPMGKISMTIRQLDKDRWEYLTTVAMVHSAAPAPGQDGMSRVLAHQAQHGATAAERAEAQKLLKQHMAMSKEVEAGRAEAIANMQEELKNTSDPEEKAALQKTLASIAPGAPMMNAQSRQVWTRIGNSCN